MKVSVVIPARNEAATLRPLLRRIAHLDCVDEIVVVDDGSTDDTASISKSEGARVIKHPYGMGNGAAVKTGARNVSGDVIVLLDADGQHDPSDIPRLLDRLSDGIDMVIGARSDSSQASLGRLLANKTYNWLASYITGHRIADLTSGFRIIRTDRFREFLFLLPNGFSYPTTITMAFFRAGYSVAYEPIKVASRSGKSHIHILRDGAKFLLIIFRIGTMYSPLKLFVPVAAAFMLTGLGWYAYTYLTSSRFTNMSALMFTVSFIVFMMGLISEQITALMYKDSGGSGKR